MKLPKLVLPLLAALLISGCTTVTGLPKPDDLYPVSITECADEPEVPYRPAPDQPRDDREKAQYVKDLHAAYVDCHDSVEEAKNRKADWQKQYDEQTGKKPWFKFWKK